MLTNISGKEKNIFKIKRKKLDIWSSFFTSIVLISERINIELVIPGGSMIVGSAYQLLKQKRTVSSM